MAEIGAIGERPDRKSSIDVLAIGTHTGKCFWFGIWRSPRLNLDCPSIWDACRRSEEDRGSAYRGFRGHESFAFQNRKP
jgi:hypothetical protein